MSGDYVVEVNNDMVQIKNLDKNRYECGVTFNSEKDLNNAVFLFHETCKLLNVADSLVDYESEYKVFIAVRVVVNGYIENGDDEIKKEYLKLIRSGLKEYEKEIGVEE